MSPFLVLLVGIVFIVTAIVVFRLHAFLALILAAVLVGIIAGDLPEEGIVGNQAVRALELTTKAFGNTCGAIGIVIALASVIGKCLMDSGAADMITRRFMRLLGEKRAPLALLGSGFVLSIPVFFDTVFYLLVPLAKALRLRTGKHYVFYILAICAGAVCTHSLVAPTPGPLIMAENLKIDLGTTILYGAICGVLPSIMGGWFYARWISRRLDIPLRETAGASLEELEAIVNSPEESLPPFWLSILPVLLPVILISSWTVVSTLSKSVTIDAGLVESFRFIGNKNFALFVATGLALYIFIRQKKIGLSGLQSVFEPAIGSAGVIILITAAGGAFGAMLKNAGIGRAIEALFENQQIGGVTLLLLSWFMAVVFKIAQGSGTVSMITTSSIMAELLSNYTLEQLPFHPIYVFMAIGFGANFVSWMNDSGFWIVGKLSGFTEKETLKTWTALLGVLSVVGLVQTLILAFILPLKRFLSWPG